MSIGERFKNAWSAFRGDTQRYFPSSFGSSVRQDRVRVNYNTLRTVANSIYGKISVHCSMININHVRLDEEGRYMETLQSSLNRALTRDANVDQTGRELIREAVFILLNNGSVAIIPTVTSNNPKLTKNYNIYELRVGKIKEWYAKEVLVEVYNEEVGKDQEVLLDKQIVAIVENPFYSIMNEPNSTGKRLIRVLNQLEQANQEPVGKLDLIIQLPNVIRSDARRKQAEDRRKDIETQLTSSKYGVAYTDGTERIVQLNRSLENNLWTQAKELEDRFFNELGLSKAVFDGSADEKTLLNYVNYTLEPILTAIVEEMERKWISPTAQTQGQAIRFFDDPFRLIPMSSLAELADKLTRNEIMTSNEIRTKIGLKPVDDKRADELRNSNLNHPDETGSVNTEVIEEEGNIQNDQTVEE